MQNTVLYKSLKSRDLIVLGLIAIFITVAGLFILNILAANKEKFSDYQRAVWTTVALERNINQLNNMFQKFSNLADKIPSTQTNDQHKNILSEYNHYLQLLDLLAHARETEIIRRDETLNKHILSILKRSESLKLQLKNMNLPLPPATIKKITLNFEKLDIALTGIVSKTLNHEFTARGFSSYQKRHFELFISISVMFVCAFGMIFLLFKQTHIIRGLRSQFYQAQKMEALGRLSGGIAHDFNNVLAAIMGYADLLSDDLKNEPQKQKFAHQISKAGEQAQQLVEQILAYSRHSQTAFTPINIIDDVKDVLSLFQASSSPNVHVFSNIAIDSAIVLGSSNQLHQVLMNICVNADDAARDEKAEVKISVDYFTPKDMYYAQLLLNKPAKDIASTPMLSEYQTGTAKNSTVLLLGVLDKKKKYISINIEDNGSGIKRDDALQIFDPFFTTKSEAKGTGLGLSAVHGIIIKHDGAIIMQTTIDKSTKFKIILPLSSQKRAVPTTTVESELAIDGHGNILLVEDELTVATMTCHMLERAGYEIVHCLNALEALEALQDSSVEYNLVLTDYKMPHMTGLELSEKLKESHPNLPVIIISGYSEEKLQDLTSGNIRAVLSKPVKANTLTKAIKDALS